MPHHGPQHIHWFPLGLALSLALVSWWLNQVTRPPQADDSRGFSHEPDAIVDAFQVRAFDIEGRPTSQLIAQRMTHYMDDDTSELVEPRLELFNPARPARVRSQRAVIGSSGDNVHFLKQVQVEQRFPDGALPATLETEYLHVIPETHEMRSDRPVVMRQGLSVVHGGGLYVDEKQKIMQLTGGVRAHFDKTR